MAGQEGGSPFHEAILQAWDCALVGSQVVYLSGPITTGPRYVRLLRQGKSSAASMEQLRRKNIDDILLNVQRLRKQRHEIVIEPASLNLPAWSQSDYHLLWEHLIERHVALIILMPGWEYSAGCAIEFAHASKHGIPAETLSGSSVSVADGIAALTTACEDLRKDNAHGRLTGLAEQLKGVTGGLRKLVHLAVNKPQGLRKDASLDWLAEQGMNVAQFVSFLPDKARPQQAYSRVAGRDANELFANMESAIDCLLNASVDHSVNVRSYEPHNPQSREFIYGLTKIDDAVNAVKRLSSEGLHTIVNETIDVSDGGVSGVLLGNVLEFAPDDTPRCVEKPGTASLPRGWGCELLSSVYGFPVRLDVPFLSRLEFSLHPKPLGWKASNIVTWEYSEEQHIDGGPQIAWPNKFSRLIGDKTFGLLVAHHLGLPVPLTTVVNRRISPFTFGLPTGWNEIWIRTAPHEQMPGLFTTHRGWIDPFVLLRAEDPSDLRISSVLAQSGVRPVYSGALIVSGEGKIIVEGRAGAGDTLMVGESNPEDLPAAILKDVRELYDRVEELLGAVRIEWVHDGANVWIV